MEGIRSLMLPQSVLAQKMQKSEKTILATSSQQTYDLAYYVKGALAGGICCAITHGGLCPVDVVKTRIQLDPVIAEEGTKGLATGLGPTVVGYFVQGWFKFGGVEFFKVNIAHAVGEQAAWDNRTGIYLGASAMAEFIADIFLCPLEATRIRLVSNPSFADGLFPAASRLLREEGFFRGFYSGFGPILFKQVPYTMAKFAVQGMAAEKIAASIGQNLADLQGGLKLGVSLASGVIAGVAAAIVSHPADTLLSKVNKAGAGGEGPIMTRLGRIAREIGFLKLCTVGLGARCIMVGTLTAGQFLLFDVVMDLTGAEKFHFHNPADKEHH
eukprot:scaffold3152_cov256-Ochromonas_danica.AAC.4